MRFGIMLVAASLTLGAQTFDKLAQQASAAREQNRLDDAIALYRLGLKQRPEWKDGLWYLATLLYDQDQYRDARDVFTRLYKLDPKNGPVAALLGLCEYETKDYGSSLTHLNRARTLGLGDNKQIAQVATYHHAILLTKFERFEASLDLLMDLVKRGLGGPRISEAAGIAALRMAVLPEELKPEYREIVAMTGNAVAAAAERNAVDAPQQLQELVAKYPSAPNVHYIYGAYLLVTDPDKGVDEMKKELEISKDHLPSLVALAFEFLKRGEPDKGLPYAERAVEVAPNSFAAHAALGRVLVDSGKTEEGIKRLEYSVKLAPDSPQVRIALASAYAKVGRATDAARERAEFLKLKNGDGAAKP